MGAESLLVMKFEYVRSVVRNEIQSDDILMLQSLFISYVHFKRGKVLYFKYFFLNSVDKVV